MLEGWRQISVRVKYRFCAINCGILKSIMPLRFIFKKTMVEDYYFLRILISSFYCQIVKKKNSCQENFKVNVSFSFDV